MEKTNRPSVTEGPCVRKTTGCGNIYVTIGRLPDNGSKPIEVFPRLGKAGGCATVFNEALGRCISLGLKWGIPIEEFAEELEDLRCPSPNMFPKTERTLSCPDAVARVIWEHYPDKKKKKEKKEEDNEG